MTRKRRSAAYRLAKKSAGLALAVPQVVAHRVRRMASAGPTPSPRERQEFTRMVMEKQQAFVQSWLAMYSETLRMQQRLALSMLAGYALPWPATPRLFWQWTRRLSEATLAVAAKGIAPVHRKAVANARRLRKTARR